MQEIVDQVLEVRRNSPLQGGRLPARSALAPRQLTPSLPSPPLPSLPSSQGLEHWVPEPGLGSLQPGPPGAAAGHTACAPHARAPQPRLATAMGTRVSCDCGAAPGLVGSRGDQVMAGKLRPRAEAFAQGHPRMLRPEAEQAAAKPSR